MKILSSLIFISIYFIPLIQTDDKVYLTHGYSNDGNGYNICEIIVHPNLDYTFKSYKVTNRKEWKNYKETSPKISYGKIEKGDNYYIHTEYNNDKPTTQCWVSKMSSKKIILYKKHKNGYLERLQTYKLII